MLYKILYILPGSIFTLNKSNFYINTPSSKFYIQKCVLCIYGYNTIVHKVHIYILINMKKNKNEKRRYIIYKRPLLI